MPKAIFENRETLPVTAHQRRREAAIKDEDIDFSEIPEFTDEDFKRMVPLREVIAAGNPDAKIEEVTVHAHRDVAKWMRKIGPQRLNAGLRAWMESESGRRRKASK
jgi:uncharacterized protein (DUF4415 family)